MPVLKDIRKTIEITLPSFPESKVVLYNSLLFGDMKEIEEMKDDLGKGILTLKFMIKSWNFTSEDGKALEVNETNYYKPQLITPQVSPIIGNISTHFNFTVWYFDADNNLPTFVNITLNSSIYAMSSIDSLDNNAIDGIEYSFVDGL